MKTKKSNSVRIPTIGVVFFSLLLATSSFFAGAAWLKLNSNGTSNLKATTNFSPKKSEKPQLKFYVMSFCPYGNQIETALKPVAELLGDKVDIKPQYIFEKIDGDINNYCQSKNPDPTQCETYVQNSQGQLKDVNDCRTKIKEMVAECADSSQYLKIGDAFYSSLHGRIEANQNVREICAWNQANDKKQWWAFVENVNTSCNAQNADQCWEEQASKAGLDTAKITQCFNEEAATLIEKEIAETEDKKVNSSPTLYLNDEAFPAKDSFGADGKGTLGVGKKVYQSSQVRESNFIKDALCTAMNKTAKECKTEFPMAQVAANQNTAAASCN